MGYFAASLSQAVGVMSIGCVYIQLFNLYFGSCMVFTQIAEDIRKDLTAFNATAQTSKGNRLDLMQQFIDLVQLYSDAKQYVLDE